MLLEDFDFQNKKKLNRINSFLKENFGFSMNVDADHATLTRIRNEVSDILSRLKVQENLSPKDPQLTKNLLILEGVELLIQRAKLVENNAYSITPRYRKIIDGLAEFVTSAIEVGDDMDDAIQQAMKEYRSSKWRFPDYEIEFDLRKEVANAVQQMEGMYEMGLAEGEEEILPRVQEGEESEEEIDEAGLSVDNTHDKTKFSRGGNMRGRKANFATGDQGKGMDQTGRYVADPGAQKNADSYLKKHGSIDWDNVGLADEVQNPTKYKTKEAGMSIDAREPRKDTGRRGDSMKGRRSGFGKDVSHGGMDKTGRSVADPAAQKKADSYLKKHGSIDWDNVGLQDDAQNWGMDSSGRHVADTSTKKKAGAFLKKGPKAKGDINWDGVSVDGGKKTPNKRPVTKRGQKAVFGNFDD